MSKRLEKQRQIWMAEYQRRVVEALPEQTGRIDWNMAHHFFHTGLAVEEAAAKAIAHLSAET